MPNKGYYYYPYSQESSEYLKWSTRVMQCDGRLKSKIDVVSF